MEKSAENKKVLLTCYMAGFKDKIHQWRWEADLALHQEVLS